MERVFIGFQKCRANAACEFVSLSEGFLQLVGYTRQEIAERFADSFFAMVEPEDHLSLRRSLEEQLAQGDHFALTYRVRAKDGRMIWLHDQGTLSREADGDYYLCQIADATRYYELDTYYRQVLDAIPNPIIITDNDLRINFINQAGLAANGMRESDCLGRPCSVFRTPYCGTEDCCAKHFLRGEPPTQQATPDGRFMRVNFAPRLDREGNRVGFISVSTDVTELVKAEQELRLSQERYRIALAQSENVLWEYHLDTRTVHCSDEAMAFYGLPREVPDMPESMIAAGVIAPEDAQAARALYARLHAGEATAQQVLRIRTAQGFYRHIHTAYTTICDEKGKPLQAIGISRDVTGEVELKTRFTQEQQYRNTMISDAVASYEVNLSRDTVQQMDGAWTEMMPGAPIIRYTQLLSRVCAQAVHPEHREGVNGMFSREAMLAAFAQGKRELSHTYLRLNQQGQMIWVLNTAYLIQNHAGGDICAFFYLKDVDEQKRRELDLEHSARYDPLTGLYNRNTAMERIDKVLQSGAPCALMILDIDNFKRINDTYGHVFGDAVLSELARKLAACLRKQQDVAGRLAGDEFILLIQDAPDQQTVTRRAQDVLDALRVTYQTDEKRCELSGSLGIAFAPEHGQDLDTLYDRVDQALYQAKRSGKNCYAIYTPQSGEQQSALHPRPSLLTPGDLGKSFAENVIEYTFRILYNAKDLKTAVIGLLELLAQHLQVDHAYLFENASSDGQYRASYEWYKDQAQSYRDRPIELDAHGMRAYLALFSQDGILCVPDVRQAEEPVRGLAASMRARCFVHCWVAVEEGYRAVLGVDDTREPRVFTPQQQQTLKIVGELIGTFLNNHRKQQERQRTTRSLQTVLLGMQYAVYVIDPLTYTLVFLNPHTQRIFPMAQVNQPCYRCLRNRDTPCPDCPIRSLDEVTQTATREIHDARTGQWLRMEANRVQWPDAGQYCMISCTEITQYKQEPS